MEEKVKNRVKTLIKKIMELQKEDKELVDHINEQLEKMDKARQDLVNRALEMRQQNNDNIVSRRGAVYELVKLALPEDSATDSDIQTSIRQLEEEVKTEAICEPDIINEESSNKESQ